MAQRKQTSKPTPQLEWQGPTAEDQGYNPSALPVNPSDQIFLGKPLPVVQPQGITERVAFTQPTRNPLHYLDGPGTDEVVTSRAPRAPQLVGEVGEAQSEMDHNDYDDNSTTKRYGVDKNKYSKGPDDGYTTNGVPIYGT